MQKFLHKQLDRIDEIVSNYGEPDDQLFHDLRSVVYLTESQSAREGNGDVLRLCQIREGGVAPALAKQIITDCLHVSLESSGVAAKALSQFTVGERFKHYMTIADDPVAAAQLTIAALNADACSTFLTPDDVASMLGVSPETVINWIKSGQLKGSNINNGQRPRYVTTLSNVSTFLELRQVQLPKQKQKRAKKISGYNRFSSTEL